MVFYELLLSCDGVGAHADNVDLCLEDAFLYRSARCDQGILAPSGTCVPAVASLKAQASLVHPYVPVTIPIPAQSDVLRGCTM